MTPALNFGYLRILQTRDALTAIVMSSYICVALSSTGIELHGVNGRSHKSVLQADYVCQAGKAYHAAQRRFQLSYSCESCEIPFSAKKEISKMLYCECNAHDR